jgi:CRISPR-associated endoribonuclease Cas6
MLRDSNPELSRKLHEPRSRKPWSFSPVFFDASKPVPGSRWCHVREKTGGRFFVNTTSADVYAAVMEASMARRRYNINDITIELGDIECNDTMIASILPSRECEIIFHSTTFFRDHADAEKTETLDPGLLARFQCDALEKAGIVTIDRERLAKHVTIARQNTRSSTGIVNKDGREVAIHGFAGTAVLRCTSPDPSIQRDFALVMATLPYTGTGSRTSMGFGHCSVRLVDGRGR